MTAAPGGSRQRILAVFDWLTDWVRSPNFHGCLFIKAAGESPEAGDRPRQVAEAFKAGCRELLEGLCSELGINDPARLARQLQLLMEGALVLASLERDPSSASDAHDAAEILIAAASAASP